MLPALNQILPADILIYALVCARVGAMGMTLPALGEAIIPPRVRLMMALALVILLVPIVGNTYPAGATKYIIAARMGRISRKISLRLDFRK